MAYIVVGKGRGFVKRPTPPTDINEQDLLWFEQTNPALNPNLGIWRTNVSGSWVSLYDKDRWQLASITVANDNDTVFTLPNFVTNPHLSEMQVLAYGEFAYGVDYTIDANTNILTYIPLHFALKQGDVIQLKYQY